MHGYDHATERETPAPSSPAPDRTVQLVQSARARRAQAADVQAATGGLGEEAHRHAAEGISGSSGSLPFAEQIQASFGRHDVSTVHAHTDASAQAANAAMGSRGYATGDHVAFGGQPDLHTAAHEAAHVVQQRGGVQLKGGVGEVGDRYEQHADAVADAVVQGKDAEGLLDRYAGGGGGAGVQARAVQFEGGEGGRKDADDRKPTPGRGMNIRLFKHAEQGYAARFSTPAKAAEHVIGRIEKMSGDGGLPPTSVVLDVIGTAKDRWWNDIALCVVEIQTAIEGWNTTMGQPGYEQFNGPHTPVTVQVRNKPVPAANGGGVSKTSSVKLPPKILAGLQDIQAWIKMFNDAAVYFERTRPSPKRDELLRHYRRFAAMMVADHQSVISDAKAKLDGWIGDVEKVEGQVEGLSEGAGGLLRRVKGTGKKISGWLGHVDKFDKIISSDRTPSLLGDVDPTGEGIKAGLELIKDVPGVDKIPVLSEMLDIYIGALDVAAKIAADLRRESARKLLTALTVSAHKHR